MNINDCNINVIPNNDFPTSYREKMIKGTIYRVTSVFKGEKELGATLEKLAIQHVLDEMEDKTKELLRA